MIKVKNGNYNHVNFYNHLYARHIEQFKKYLGLPETEKARNYCSRTFWDNWPSQLSYVLISRLQNIMKLFVTILTEIF